MGDALLGPSGVLFAQQHAIKSLPPQFSTKGLIEEQYEAISKDGTKVPYFIVYKDTEGISLVLSCLVLSCLVLSCLVLSCLVLSRLSCLVLSIFSYLISYRLSLSLLICLITHCHDELFMLFISQKTCDRILKSYNTYLSRSLTSPTHPITHPPVSIITYNYILKPC